MRSSFIEVLSSQVEIPIIQRDFAQGRTDDKTNKIRRDFLDALFDFLKLKIETKSDKQIELDFIYGFFELNKESQSKFIPIDGQQRLTTLWLMYWWIGMREQVVPNERTFLANFMYETRHSTTQFCSQLLTFSSTDFETPISESIKDNSWYIESWDYDQSIQAMLVVLDDIQLRYSELGSDQVWSYLNDKSCPFYFYKLDMKAVGLTDDLYIKMNSRGKALTEFEYFKASFSDLIANQQIKDRFDNSVDGIWMDTIWNLVRNSKYYDVDEDIAQTVDNAFLNLFNFIVSVIVHKLNVKSEEKLKYIDTIQSFDTLKLLNNDENLIHIFNIFDAISNQLSNNPSFWKDNFYFKKAEFESKKVRLFFQHEEVNLIERCLFQNKGLSIPEQLLLYSAIIHLLNDTPEFNHRLRIVRNIVVNSNRGELRDETIGKAFLEIEDYISSGSLNTLKYFNTDQIKEEKSKSDECYSIKSTLSSDILKQLEDSNIFRGCVFIFDFDSNFDNRALKFLEIFDEDDFVSDFVIRAKLLFCFGDYTQKEDYRQNILTNNQEVIRNFFTTPGYNKEDLKTKTKVVLTQCLDFFITNPKISIQNKINETLKTYKANPKDWIYYFIKYDTFWDECLSGYYQWMDNDYSMWKMRRSSYKGGAYYWNPFLYEINNILDSKHFSLESYGNSLIFTLNRKKVSIDILDNGFIFEDFMTAGTQNTLLEELLLHKSINKKGELIIKQNADGVDLEDRLEKLNQILESILNKKD